MHVIGTAGHVDHGKSALVRALTGTDPDRWLEEKLRGMTLDLGFAHLRLSDGTEAGIVDVPGHERFLHNMLAGAAGMELLLLVIAANEGPRPQTVEHLAILDYLNVRGTIVVLTKSDLVAPDDLPAVRARVADAVRGTVAENAPMIPVSVITGEGLDELRAAIGRALRSIPVRDATAPPLLPVDRVFTMQGYGTIVTGTLMQGTIAAGDSLQLTPLGRPVRARTLQVFGERRNSVAAGSRVAVNLPGVDRAEITRGDVLASPQFEARSAFDVTFRPLADAVRMLRRRTPVRAYIGAAELLGSLVFDAIPASAEACTARLYLRAPAVVRSNETFVVRRMSPKDLLGGGTIGGSHAAGDSASDDDETTTRVIVTLANAGLEGSLPAAIGASLNLREAVVASALERARDDGHVHRLAKPDGYVVAEAVDALSSRVREALEQSQEASPWLIGMTSLGLARTLAIPEPTLARALALLAEDGRIAHRAGYFSTPGFAPALTPEQRGFFEHEFGSQPPNSFAPISFPELIAHMRASRIAGLSAAFDALVAGGAVVKVADAVYRSQQIDGARRKLEELARRDGTITPAALRDVLGTSRKFVVPLLEWFDATGVTVRSGDGRALRRPQSSPERITAPEGNHGS